MDLAYTTFEPKIAHSARLEQSDQCRRLRARFEREQRPFCESSITSRPDVGSGENRWWGEHPAYLGSLHPNDALWDEVERLTWQSEHPALFWSQHPCDEWDEVETQRLAPANDNSRRLVALATDFPEQPNGAATSSHPHLPLARGATASTREGRGDAFRSASIEDANRSWPIGRVRTSVGRGLPPKATGELVERSTFQGYGGTESDYRPGRWKNFREDYRFTGKEEDVEVGLQYFGKRFLNPLLGRWVSADPLAVHGFTADANLYAYVSGRVLRAIDPVGLQDAQVGSDPSVKNSAEGYQHKEPVAKGNSAGSGLTPEEKADGRKAFWGTLWNYVVEGASDALATALLPILGEDAPDVADGATQSLKAEIPESE